jgi:hypothetical protein
MKLGNMDHSALLRHTARANANQIVCYIPIIIIVEYRMVFPAGLRDPCTRDVARLSKSVKILEPQASVFLRFPKVEQHPKCMVHAILLGKTIW